MKKIDLFAHCSPKKFMDAFANVEKGMSWKSMAGNAAWAGGESLWDVNKRLEIMEPFEDYVQILVPATNAVENFGPRDAAYLIQTFNDAVSEWVNKYPQKFVGAVAALPSNNIDAALKEIDRAIKVLGCKGVMLHTPIYVHDGSTESIKSLDAPEFWPIYESMAKYNLPIWIHPGGMSGVPVYPGEPKGRYGLYHVFGWPIESMMAMSRLIYSGVMTKYPTLKFIIHHCGSMIVPALASRIEDECADYGIGARENWDENKVFKTKTAIDYYKMFYGDTALYGGPEPLEFGIKFYGVEHTLFGTDFPWDRVGGTRFIKNTIEAVKRLNISEPDKELIFAGNARRILRLEI